MGLWLEIHEAGRVEVHEIVGSELSVGRGDGNDVALEDPRSSRHHCRVLRTPQGVLLEDLDSRNGTLLNGYAVKKSFLRPGDEFRIGAVRCILREGEMPPAAAPPAPGPVEEAPDRAGTLARTVSGPAGKAEPDSGASRSVTPPVGRPSGRGPERHAEGVGPAAPRPPAPETVEGRPYPRPSAGAPPPTGAGSREVPVARFEANAYLEGLEGPLAGSRIRLDRTPFVLGRGKDCDCRVEDKRASSQHARIVAEKDVFRVEDLGSTNGTLLNHRLVQQAVLTPGAVLQIGNCSFRVHVPAPPADAGAAAGPAEDFLEFDRDRFLAKSRAEHPVVVGAIVLILAIFGYFAVDLTRRIVARPRLDPPDPSNLMGESWSFEDGSAARRGSGGEGGGAAPGGDVVPGWKLGGWPLPGDPASEPPPGRLELTRDGAQIPGVRALRVFGSEGGRLVYAGHEVVGLEAGGGGFRLEGRVLNESAQAAGLLVEFLRDSREGTVVIGRSLSETARSPREAIDVDQIVEAPAAALRARVSCFVLGGGSAVFDRIAFTQLSAADRKLLVESREGSPEDGEPGGAAGAADPRFPGARQTFAIPGASGAKADLHLVAGATGAFSIDRPPKLELVRGLWAGLSPSQDPYGLGPRAAAPRAFTVEKSSLLWVIDVIDTEAGRWVPLECKAVLGRDDVTIRWRTTATAAEGGATALVVWLELQESTPVEEQAEPAAEGPGSGSTEAGEVREVVIGEQDERVSLVFSTPIRLMRRPHPLDPSIALWTGECGSPELEVGISRRSPHQSRAALAAIRRAEEAFAEGRVAEAFQALGAIRGQFPKEEDAIRISEERLAEWRGHAADALRRLRADRDELAATGAPVLHDLLVARVDAYAARYAGTAEGRDAAALREEIEKAWAARQVERSETMVRHLYDAGKRHFAREELYLAKLYLGWVVAESPGSPLARDAEDVLGRIEGRLENQRKLLLK